MGKWNKVIPGLVGVVVACATLILMTGSAFAAGPVIVLDPGHSGTSITTIDPETQVMDKEYSNMPEMQDVFGVATILKAKLEAVGYTVLMTKQAYTDTVTKRQRVDLANSNNAALAVSIHTSGHTFGTWGQTYVQRLDGYRVDVNGNKVYFNLPTVAALSQQYGQSFLTERRKIEGSSVTITVDSFDGRDLAGGNLPIVQLWSKVPWVYCEAGALQSDYDRQMYALSLYNSIVTCVPMPGVTPTPPPYVRYDQGDINIVKAGVWADFTTASAYRGSYGRSSTSGASATIYFKGSRLDWMGMKGTTTGLADVYVDGVKATSSPINLAAGSATYQVPLFSTGVLPPESHTVKIVRSASSASGKFLTLDAVDIWGTISTPPVIQTRFEQTNTSIAKTGTWSDFSTSKASGATYGRSSTSGASATIRFIGTRLDWIGMKGLTTGIADVYLDGTKMTTINLAATSATYQVNLWSTGTLVYGLHTFKLVRSASSASGKFLTLDAVDVWGRVTS
jgi:hypothetical protein